VKDIVLGADGIIKNLKPNSIVVDMSSVSPIESKDVARGLEKKDCFFLDAPVSGGEPKAIDGTLAFMVGGEEEIFNRVRPYFNTMGSSALLVGPNGSGSMTKLANQIIVNLNIAAMSEALVLAQKGGADPEKVFKAIRGGLAGSAVLEAKAPMVVERNFKAGGRIDINLKDIKNVMATAHEIDVPLPMTGQLLEIMQALKVDGKAGDDHGGIIQYFEKLAGVEVKKHCEIEMCTAE
jgi:2-hydroxy-3-oxopropionate reductase